MKKALAGIGALMALVLLIVMITVTSDEDDKRALNCFGGSGTGAGQVAPLPAGSTSKPTKTGTTQLTSGYKSPDRPGHRGVDLAGPLDTPIYAMADGVVAKSGTATGFGHWIVLNHNIGGKIISTVYGHMYENGLLVKEGEQVRAGQMIGNDGESTGPHLHFEVWNGTRESGTETDPTPFIDSAAEPGSSGAAGGGGQPHQSVPGQQEPKPVSQSSTDAGSMPELPAEKGSEEHMTVDSVRIMRAIASKFPQVKQIGGWRPSDPYPDHPSGRAVDIMIPDYNSEQGKALGEQINGYLLTNAQQFNIQYTIFRQQYKQPDGTGNTMEDRGGDTANHMDHVHATVAGDGGGLATPGQKLDGTIPDGGTWGGSTGGCFSPGAPGAGGDVNAAAVPPEYVEWLRKAGSICPSISPALLAAQINQESGFNRMAMSGSGAMGPSQFMPGTWPNYGQDDDGNGTVSPYDIGDALMAQGRYMCKIAEILDPDIASGKIKTPSGQFGRESSISPDTTPAKARCSPPAVCPPEATTPSKPCRTRRRSPATSPSIRRSPKRWAKTPHYHHYRRIRTKSRQGSEQEMDDNKKLVAVAATAVVAVLAAALFLIWAIIGNDNDAPQAQTATPAASTAGQAEHTGTDNVTQIDPAPETATAQDAAQKAIAAIYTWQPAVDPSRGAAVVRARDWLTGDLLAEANSYAGRPEGLRVDAQWSRWQGQQAAITADAKVVAAEPASAQETTVKLAVTQTALAPNLPPTPAGLWDVTATVLRTDAGWRVSKYTAELIS